MSASQEDPLVRRVRRVRHALGLTRDEAVEAIKVHHSSTERGQATLVDFNQGRSLEELENVAFSLLANIASLKDHLKSWCKSNGVQFRGDTLINANRDVAIVHDLWNIDKHAELDRAPRSGLKPALRELRQSMVLSSGTTAGSAVSFSLDPRTGRPVIQTTGGGSAALVIDAQVVDENGTILGTLQGICASTLDAWEKEMLASGIILPSP
jgi:hypothetical protein